MDKDNNKMRKKIKEILDLFPEVKWDRWSGKLSNFTVFGWIKRPDGKSDFLLLDIEYPDVARFRTSSAELSKTFSKRLGYQWHEKCKKVSDLIK